MPRSISRSEIEDSRSTKSRVLRAAAKLFATNGFRGTSLRQIAIRAKVNEVTIFRLFNSKRGLYREVLDGKLQKTRLLTIPPEVGVLDDQILPTLAQELQQVLDPEFIRLVFFAALENPEEMRKSVSPQMDRYYDLIAEYLQRQIHNGAIRQADPRIMAKALVALLVYDSICFDFQSGPPESSETLKAQTSCLLEIWLNGVTRPKMDRTNSASLSVCHES